MSDSFLRTRPDGPDRHIRLLRFCVGVIGLWCVVSGVLAWSEWQGVWHGPKNIELQAFRAWLNWSSLAAPLVLVAAGVRLLQAARWPAKVLWLTVVVLCAIGNWARLVEPQMLVVRSSTVQGIPAGASPLRIALVSDIHLGTYVRQWHLQKLVNQLNALEVDVVVVAGDWTYEPPLDLVAAFAPIGQLRHPVLAVLGNHDVEKPGPALQAQLRAALEQHRVTFLEGKSLQFKGWEWVGVGDYWGGQPEKDVKKVLASPNPRRIVVTHQPDAVSLFPPHSAFLTVAGHTHGGQIQLPWLTVKNMEQFTVNPWYQGRYDLPQSTLFVTTGTGFTGLPARFLTPPRIDVLRLQP